MGKTAVIISCVALCFGGAVLILLYGQKWYSQIIKIDELDPDATDLSSQINKCSGTYVGVDECTYFNNQTCYIVPKNEDGTCSNIVSTLNLALFMIGCTCIVLCIYIPLAYRFCQNTLQSFLMFLTFTCIFIGSFLFLFYGQKWKKQTIKLAALDADDDLGSRVSKCQSIYVGDAQCTYFYNKSCNIVPKNEDGTCSNIIPSTNKSLCLFGICLLIIGIIIPVIIGVNWKTLEQKNIRN